MPLHESVVARNRAETKKFEEEARRHTSEARRAEAEADLASAEARKESAYAEQEIISLHKDMRDERDELAKDNHYHVYVFDETVTDNSVKKCIVKLNAWDRIDADCEIEIQINSPGGDIIAGLALIDSIRLLEAKGHTITTVALGMAASMGGVILQAGNNRVMGKNAMLLLHEGSMGAIGDFGQVEDRVKLMEKLHERILDIFTERSIPQNAKTTREYIKKHWKRTDWWVDSEEALKLGFVDEVR
jgi:ATP-dependent Clp endopeptidase proteolytic subunit ClpP